MRPLRVDFQPRDSRGLIWGYCLASLAPRALDRQPALTRGAEWYHFNLVDGRARKWLSEQSDLPEIALNVLLDPHPRVRVLLLPEGVVGTLIDLQHDFRGDPEQFGELRFYVGETRVISARRRPLQTVDDLHRQLQAGEAPGSPADWLGALLDRLTHNFAEVTRELVETVDTLEDEIAGGTSTPHQRARLAALRRLLVRFRRHVHANRLALRRARGGGAQKREFERASRRGSELLDEVEQDLDLLHERVRMLQDEVGALLAEASNRNLYVLSVVTTALLPASLVTGVWGMNVGGLPWLEDAYGAVWAALTLLSSILLSLWVLRRTRVL